MLVEGEPKLLGGCPQLARGGSELASTYTTTVFALSFPNGALLSCVYIPLIYRLAFALLLFVF